ncbi:MAG: PQQ-dependent sugar dehydrogenase [Pseudobdellovibrionaceae bacterium]|nr:PQQ-dependent sugar dehydrogenase [Pseudobdellovibrionaceae bacterium]
MIRQTLQLSILGALWVACDSGSERINRSESLASVRPSNKSCLAFERPQLNTAVKLERAFSTVTAKEIISLIPAPTGDRFYAVQKNGLITTFSQPDGSDKTTFLDFRETVNASAYESGLLGMAFHPNKPNEFYLSYTVSSSASPANLRSTIARFHTTDGLTATNQPEVLLTLEQPYNNHNGGDLSFGPDGYLYVAFGDGGSGGDPQNNSQNLNVLLGKILRVDVNNPGAYAVPADNPFVGAPNARGEIYAYGLRNPWRFSFDRGTGDMWAGDVGQSRFEEIDIIKKGGNYGWKIKEGTECYNAATCAANNSIDPVFTYGRTEGASITGGFVYRGKNIPSLHGLYIFGDFVSGNIWSLNFDENGKAGSRLLLSSGFNVSSFAQDRQGELFVLDYTGGGIYRLIASEGSDKEAKIPSRLSATGCLQTEGLIPYEVNSPLWSDGATKRRWMALPDGTQLSVSADGHVIFPKGSVLVKEFSLNDKPIETRLMVLHNDGSWAGYTYEWDDKGADANLVANGATKTVAGQAWSFPSQGQCMQCHNAAAGYSLGLELNQLNRMTADSSSQLDIFEQLQLFDKPLQRPFAQLPEPQKASSAADSARSYLNANCAFCHRPGGTGGGSLDLRYDTPLSATGLCNAKPSAGDLGLSDALLLAPGAPERSVLMARLSVRGSQQMPPVASNKIDSQATQWVHDWIKALKDCNP